MRQGRLFYIFIAMINFMNDKSNHFKKLILEDQLHHAYIFIGEDKNSVKEFAKNLAGFLEGHEFSEGSEVLVDAHIIQNVGSSIGIEVVRELKNFLWQRPIKSKKRTVIICDAEALTHEAQNAILKITEDPPKTALIILTVKNIESLLSTIVSRFQKVYFKHHYEDRPRSDGDRVGLLVSEFLRADPRGKQAIVKKIAEDERDGEANLTINFLDALILELSKNAVKNSPILKEILKRRRLLGQYSLNKRLQLAFLATLW